MHTKYVLLKGAAAVLRQMAPTPIRSDLRGTNGKRRSINATHRFVYFAPEAVEEAAKLGVTDRGPAYFAFRSAAMGAVPWQVALAAFYNFSPRSVRPMTGVWDAASTYGQLR
jgi:helix-turn-helix protein